MGPTGPTGTTGQDITTVFSTTGVTIGPATGFTLVPGLSTTVTVPASSKVLISTYGGVATSSVATGGFSTVDVVLFIDGAFTANGAYERIIVSNNTGLVTQLGYWTFTTAQPVTAGVHTFQIGAAGTGGASANATVGGDGTSVLQGELSVTFIKQ